jgi:LEA14-like dessication related protein
MISPARIVTPVLLLALAACPGITRPLEKPTVQLNTVGVVSVGFTGLHARANFNLTNPNQVSLPLRAFDWSLSIGGSSPIRGRVDIAHTIPAMGSTPVDVDLMVGAAAAVDMASRLASGAKDYHLTGTLHFETQLGDIAVAIDHEGSLEDLR